MDQEKFFKILSLLKQFTVEELRESRRNMMDILDIIVSEKRIASSETRRAMHNLNISNRSKKKRIQYIDDHLLPGRLKAIKLDIVPAFGDAQSGILNRINQLQREKDRIQKNSNEHDLKAKINIRNLIGVYEEEKKILNYLDLLTAADLIHHFIVAKKIDLVMLTNEEYRNLYVEYMSRGE